MNKTLHFRIYKYLLHTGRSRYVDVLPELVAGYINVRHFTLAREFTHEEADIKENEVTVGEIHGQRYHDTLRSFAQARTRRRFKKGQLVRITLARGRKVGPEGRANTPFFSDELFVVVSSSRRMPVPKCPMLRYLLTLNRAPGTFYANELTLHSSRLFEVEKVLRTRVEDGSTLKLVELCGLHPGFNSGLPEDTIDINRRVNVTRLECQPNHSSLTQIAAEHVICLSNASLDLYPENPLTRFTHRLPKPIDVAKGQRVYVVLSTGTVFTRLR